MAGKHTFVGLDIGSSMIRVVAAERTENGMLSILGVGEAEAQGMRRGAIATPDQTARSIQKALSDLRKSSGVETDHACVSLGEPRITAYVSKGAVSISRADGEVTREDVSRVGEAAEAALPRLTNREIIHSFPLSYTVDRDSNIRDPIGLLGMKLEVETLFILAFAPHVKNLFKALELANISADDVLAASYAASFHAMNKKQKEVGTLLVDIGAATSTLAVFEEGLLVSLETIPVGSGHITYDIGLGFQIDIVSAERVKRNLGPLIELGKKEIRLSDYPKNFEETFSQKKLREIVSARLGDIFELIEKHLRRIERAELLPGGVILIGGGAELFDMAGAARDALHLPAEVLTGTPGITGKKELVSRPEWATALGLAKYAAVEHEPAGRMTNFLSSPLSRRISKILRAFIP